MKILSTNVYVGPSLYAHFPVIRHHLDLGVLEEWPSGRLGSAFVDRLIEALPGLQNHGCSYGEPGGFIRRMREEEGTWMGHIWEHASLELQNIAGSDVSFGRTRSAGPVGEYNMVFQYKQREVGLEAARILRRDPHGVSIPIIAVSAAVIGKEADEAGSELDGFIPKPLSRETLVRGLMHFLPQRIVFTEPEAQKPASADIGPDAIASLPAVIKDLNGQMDEWLRLQERMVVNEIEEFGLLLASMGKERGIDLLEQWGERLREASVSFDMAAMETAMGSYPELLAALESLKIARGPADSSS